MVDFMKQARGEDAKAYLQRGWKLEKRVRAREEQLQALRDRITRVRSAMPVGLAGDRRGPKRDWTDAVDALTDAEGDYVREIAALYGVQREIRDALEAVEPEIYRELLQYRYIYCLDWDAVAEKLDYDRRYVFKLHDRALRALEAAQADIERQPPEVVK